MIVTDSTHVAAYFAPDVEQLARRQVEGSGASGDDDKRLNVEISRSAQPISRSWLAGSRLLYLRAPTRSFAAEEKQAIIAFAREGGSLLLVLYEERRPQLATTGVNDLIAPFGMALTPDTPYLHNCGAIAKAGEINAADREIPYSGGRAVEGGTPFAYQLDKEGRPAQPFAAWKKLDGGRIVVMAEGMPSLFLGTREGQRLTGVPRDAAGTTYWARTAASSWRRSLAWLVKS